VVGINTAGITRPDFFAIKDVPDSYATPIDTALSVVDDVEHGRMSTRVHVGPTAYLGVALAGNKISGVVAGSPAARAGLRAGAAIASIDGHVLRSADQLTTALLAKHPGDAIAIDWIDAAGRHKTAVVLGRGPAL
jgi:S1-C subfamily serine protease